MRLFGSYKESKYDKQHPAAAGRFVRPEAPAPKAPADEPRAERMPKAPAYAERPAAAEATQQARAQRAASVAAPFTPAAPEREQPLYVQSTGRRKKSKRKKHRQRMIALGIIVCLLMVSYFAIFWIPWVQKDADGRLHPNPIFGKLQNYLITNSRESHSYQWVQYAYPWYIRQLYVDADSSARNAQVHFNSELDPEQIRVTDPISGEPLTERLTVENMTPEQEAFYELFWELDIDSTEQYLAEHPSLLSDGYEKLYINEAGLDDNGTSIRTTKGEQVLAIDAWNGVLLVRINGDTYRGVLATAKDPERLHLFVSAGISSNAEFEGYGQTAGTIANKHNGILAITGSGFVDEDGVGTGGAVAGFCRSDGVNYGYRHREWGCKRLELRENNWLYVTDSQTDCRSDVTNAMEFEPAMIVDGQRQPNYVYTSENPRACVGQNDYGEILFLAIEGRQAPITGCSVSVCTDILLEHRCITAMNMDGGTSAMLWYDGEPVIRCCNLNTPQGRYLPNAWVYVRKN